ncbi:sensor histidine kinase [Candidatus Contubernalis alkaliaceticus]|uniref:sensor histidine kinase n=1 Tax=Candidatus Contubernalis alkaliaceticus TaxID=338645 RepID=UPI001F4BDEDD|nr:HAMP domain-containing sensor histidine kinase [Candidatus Contubernalis alkalaceticus]
MKLTKNPEVAGLLKTLIICFAIFTTLTLVAGIISIGYIKTNITRHYAAVVGTVTENYPQAEQDVIRLIISDDPEAVSMGQAVLTRYGINSPDILLNTKSIQNIFVLNTALYLFLALLTGGTVTLVMGRFLKKQYGQIHEITRYAGQTAEGNYCLDIRDNNEGDISILKNEIYKITTMLKKQAEHQKKDKIALADSLADISHQLKTPMTSLLMLNDLLYNVQSPEVKNKFLDRMKSQLERIQWLVTSLLTLSKLDAGTITMKKEKVYMKTLVNKVLETMEIPLDIKMQQVLITGEENTSFTGDYKWTCEAVINILKNCIEHTPEKGSINISFTENPIFTMITISDSGPGIDKEDIPYIFNRFYKGKNAGEDSVGIGLAMASAIVEKQGGDITVKSDREKGSEFTVKFYK